MGVSICHMSDVTMAGSPQGIQGVHGIIGVIPIVASGEDRDRMWELRDSCSSGANGL